MSSDIEQLHQAALLKAARQIQATLGRTKRPTLRACGLLEEVAQALVSLPPSEQIAALTIAADDGSVLDRYAVRNMTAVGLAILARGDVAEPSPLRVQIEPPHKSVFAKIYEGTRSGWWDLVKIAFGAFLTWLFSKH